MGLFDKLRNRTKAETTKATKKSSKVAPAASDKKIIAALLNQAPFAALPVVTEKASILQSTGKYSFVVPKSAGKIAIAHAVERLYNVDVVKVNVLNTKGKTVVRGRTIGKRKDLRKAIVTIKAGQTIAVFEPKEQAAPASHKHDGHDHDHAAEAKVAKETKAAKAATKEKK